VRVVEPPPHDFVQSLQAPNAETPQLNGHGPRLQDVLSVSAPHAAPP
jgi:hypothetical protein